MKVWCPARGQTEADAVVVPARFAPDAAKFVAEQWHGAGDRFDRETFRVDTESMVLDVSIVVIRSPRFAAVDVQVVRKEQG